MTVSLRSTCLALFTVALAAPLHAEELTGDAIKDYLGGNTFEGAMIDTGEYKEYYESDGTIRGADYTGTWSVDGNAACFEYEGVDKTCFKVDANGDEVKWVDDEGNVDGTGRRASGNTNQF